MSFGFRLGKLGNEVEGFRIFDSEIAPPYISVAKATILDSNGLPVSNAKIELISKSGKIIVAYTDENGNANISANPNDTYTLTVSGNGFTTQTIDDWTFTEQISITVETKVEPYLYLTPEYIFLTTINPQALVDVQSNVDWKVS